ncbi:hypothetical protein EJB05_38040, partial [Eragrostis curvula]
MSPSPPPPTTAPAEAPPWPPPPPSAGATASTYASPTSRVSSSSYSSPSARPPAAQPPPAPGPPSCAACKHQRRKCTPDCVLAPYFPSSQPEKFRNARRLFGVKNMLHLLQAAGPEKRELCMRTIVYESDVRRQEPVHGCLAVIRDLENQLRDTYIELAAVQEQLALGLLQAPESSSHGSAAASPTTATTSADVVRHQQQTLRWQQAAPEMQSSSRSPRGGSTALSLAARELTVRQPDTMQLQPALSGQSASDMVVVLLCGTIVRCRRHEIKVLGGDR